MVTVVTGTTVPGAALQGHLTQRRWPLAAGTVRVTITVRQLRLGQVVTETLPAGFSYVSSSLRWTARNDITEDNGQQMVTFVLVGGERRQPFTYRVTVKHGRGPFPATFTVDRCDESDVTGNARSDRRRASASADQPPFGYQQRQW